MQSYAFPQSRTLFVGALLAALASLPSPVIAAEEPSQDPFASLEGSWTGVGTIVARDGHSENIRCRAKYFASPSGRNLDQQLRCASDSYRFDVNSGLVRQGDGSIAGTWTETTRNASGRVTAQEQGDSIMADIAGPNFTAKMNVTTQGDRQSVEIQPNGSDIAEVTIAMNRE